jgi:hypothetical protein
MIQVPPGHFVVIGHRCLVPNSLRTGKIGEIPENSLFFGLMKAFL